MIRKSILELDVSWKSEIDQFIDLNNGLVFHYTGFNEIVSSANKTKLSYIIAVKKNEIIGVCPIHRINKGFLHFDYSNNWNYEIPYGGWVYNINQIDFDSLWKRLPVALFGSLTYCSSFVYDIPERLKKTGKNFETGLIDLSIPVEVIWQNYIHPNKRNKIRKAEKSGIIIEKHGIENLYIFLNLIKETRRKAGLCESITNYYEKLLNEYLPDNAVVLVSYYEKRPISGVVVLGNKNIMHYWLGASADNVPNLGQGELLQWEAIKWAKGQNARYYDLCVIEKERLPNIAHFKMGFTKELVPFYILSKKTILFKGFNKIKNAITN